MGVNYAVLIFCMTLALGMKNEKEDDEHHSFFLHHKVA